MASPQAVEHDSGVLAERLGDLKESILGIHASELVFQEKEHRKYIQPSRSSLDALSSQARGGTRSASRLRGAHARDVPSNVLRRRLRH